MTTKEQERKALQQIRRIVASLGSGSYVGTALEGCLDIAEQNIDNDWACSMQQRAESAEKNAEAAEISRRDALAAVERWKDIAEKRQAAAEAAEKDANNLRYELAKTRGELQQQREFIENAKKVYAARIRQLEKNMLSAADMLAAYADAPADIAYKNALANYRTAKSERDDLQGELKKLEQ